MMWNYCLRSHFGFIKNLHSQCSRGFRSSIYYILPSPTVGKNMFKKKKKSYNKSHTLPVRNYSVKLNLVTCRDERSPITRTPHTKTAMDTRRSTMFSDTRVLHGACFRKALYSVTRNTAFLWTEELRFLKYLSTWGWGWLENINMFLLCSGVFWVMTFLKRPLSPGPWGMNLGKHCSRMAYTVQDISKTFPLTCHFSTLRLQMNMSQLGWKRCFITIRPSHGP